MHTPEPPPVSLLEHPVSLIMSTGDLITAEAEEDLAVALEVFRQGRISHIPILSGGSKLVGVVSWGKKRCSGDGQPGAYTRIASYLDWIRQAMRLDPSKNALP